MRGSAPYSMLAWFLRPWWKSVANDGPSRATLWKSDGNTWKSTGDMRTFAEPPSLCSACFGSIFEVVPLEHPGIPVLACLLLPSVELAKPPLDAENQPAVLGRRA